MSGLDCAPLLISAAVPFCPPSHRGLRPTRMPDLQAAAGRDQPASGVGHRRKAGLHRSGDRPHHRLALHRALLGALRHPACWYQVGAAVHCRCCRTLCRHHTLVDPPRSLHATAVSATPPRSLHIQCGPLRLSHSGVDSHVDLRHALFSDLWELQLVFACALAHYIARCVGVRSCSRRAARSDCRSTCTAPLPCNAHSAQQCCALHCTALHCPALHDY